MEAGAPFAQKGGMTVGLVFNMNECSVIDCSAVGAQTWMGNERGGRGGRERGHRDRAAYIRMIKVHPKAQLHPGPPGLSEHAEQLKSL